MEGKKISTNETYIIPANVVFFLYDPIEVDKQFIPQSTTGLSAGMTIEDAILQGLCETIERDSYIVYYRNQLKTQTVKLDSIKNSNLLNLINELSLKNIKIHIKYLKNETQVYVMHCVTEDVSGEFPIYTHGVGASTNPEVAIIRAITEAIQMRVSQIEVNKNYEQFKDDSSFEAYMTWGNGDKLKVGNLLHEDGDEIVLLSSLKFSNYSSLKEEILDIVNTLDKSGYDVYVCNLSRNDTPAYVVRVIIPGYQDGIHAFNRITHRMKKLPELLNQDCRVPLFDEVLFT